MAFPWILSHVSSSLLYWRLLQYPVLVSAGLSRGITFMDLLAKLCLMQPKGLFSFFAVMMHC